VTLSPQATARDAIQSLNTSTKGIVLVMEESRLLGTITDGDIRRALLDKFSLDVTLEEILANKKKNSANAVPVVASLQHVTEKYLQLMRDHRVQQLPLLDTEGFVV